MKVVLALLVVGAVATFSKIKKTFENVKEDVISEAVVRGKTPAQQPGAPAPAPSAAVAPVATTPSTPTADSGAPASGAPTPPGAAAPTTAAAPASASGEDVSIVESTLLLKCSTDGGLCMTTGLTYAREGAFAIAARFFSKACDQRIGAACANLGMYYKAGLGVPRSDTRAAEFNLQACQLKEASSCLSLGMAHLRGEGIARSPSKAREALERGCALNDGESCLVLGVGSAELPDGSRGVAGTTTTTSTLAKGCQLLNLSSCNGGTAAAAAATAAGIGTNGGAPPPVPAPNLRR